MARFNDIGSGSFNASFGEILSNLTINALSTMSRGLFFEMISANINDFNLMNHDFMNIHMMRNHYEKEITLSYVGENSYTDGNPDAQATPALYPSYTRGNNYMEFVSNTRQAEKNGVLTTRSSDKEGNVTNYYLDDDSSNSYVAFTGSSLDRNSILYKTKKLMRQHKLKTIISEYHTNGVEYVGQVGSKYGESHGRNLLTKNAENGIVTNDEYGYDNPYCRVWTHNNKYDKIKKTIRANSGELNIWDNFEWDKTDEGHKKDESEYGDGEIYDYAWKGKHNQTRRWENSVLDPKTGLVKITPQYRGGREVNRHTKECMFSIENLAWKDYDPYSFEQALSWEQRGPLGGRIMWFPPYGIEINETASARWNSNDFIGRGEPVYTYVNSERTGNLSFIMLTDHPSSVDYASWWDDNNIIKGVDNGDGNSENDYLRYFAGCNNDNSDGKSGGLIVKPTPLTDEYIETPPPTIKLENVTKKNTPPEHNNPEDKNPETVEFFVFFPNNYSGILDTANLVKNPTQVDAIAYLLGGRNAQKTSSGDIIYDKELKIKSAFDHSGGRNIGYEMSDNPITTDDCVTSKEYIQGGKLISKTDKEYDYVVEDDKKWCYRIDHWQPYVGGRRDGTNLICEKLLDINYKDADSKKINLDVSNNSGVSEMAKHKENLYSFAEVAAALYSEEINNKPSLYGYLVDCGVNMERVEKLIKIFTSKDQPLSKVEYGGMASSQGYSDENKILSKNRGRVIQNWILENFSQKNIEYKSIDNEVRKVDETDKTNVNGVTAKLARCAHVIMSFTSGETVTSNNSTAKETVIPLGFDFVREKTQLDGTVWTYYKKNDTVKYYEQTSNSQDNYEKPTEDDKVLNETQIIEIFNNDNYKPFRREFISENNRYRGRVNQFGAYNQTWDYKNNPDLEIELFEDYLQYNMNDYVYHEDEHTGEKGFYMSIDNYSGLWDYDKFANVSHFFFHYCIGDYVLGSDNKYYRITVDIDQNETDFSLIQGVNCELATDEEIYEYGFDWQLMGVINKVASVLCYTENEVIKRIIGNAEYQIYSNSEYDCIWKYCQTNNLMTDINTGTNLVSYAQSLEPYSINPTTTHDKIVFSSEEQKYINLICTDKNIIAQENYIRSYYGLPDITMLNIPSLREKIILCRILDGITMINDGQGSRRVCSTPVENEDEMKEKTTRKDESVTEGCEDSLWVDRGDGMLIQKCNINTPEATERFNPKTGGDWNKLRYDQEYHFYKQYMEDHPLIFEKLQEKIKYFNPAFHSMTPEGFNTRCTFLQQCTRQGNTKTMSDEHRRTANNLAFGRPPYCVLRLGDFYNQMIVIKDVSFDFNVSEGLQWDLNTEGNGVQPMLCKVNISFNFIGGGDITGPVQRLQNAMSFNYYANTSFYDNRADRVEYQPTNWATMGGAGNDEINYDKSYAYIAQRYEPKSGLVVPD